VAMRPRQWWKNHLRWWWWRPPLRWPRRRLLTLPRLRRRTITPSMAQAAAATTRPLPLATTPAFSVRFSHWLHTSET